MVRCVATLVDPPYCIAAQSIYVLGVRAADICQVYQQRAADEESEASS